MGCDGTDSWGKMGNSEWDGMDGWAAMTWTGREVGGAGRCKMKSVFVVDVVTDAVLVDGAVVLVYIVVFVIVAVEVVVAVVVNVVHVVVEAASASCGCSYGSCRRDRCIYSSSKDRRT